MSLIPKYNFTLNEVIEEKRVTKEEVEAVRLWMKDVHFPSVSDELIVTFLIACKRDFEVTKRTIRSYYVQKKKHPDLFNNWDIDDKDLAFSNNVIFHASFPVRTDDNDVVHMFRLNDTRYYNVHLDIIAKLLFMLAEVALNRGTPPNGLKVIIDAKGAGLMHLTRLGRPRIAKYIIDFLQEGMPLNLKEIHVINTILMVDKLIFMFKPFMQPELYNKIHLHPYNTDMEEFSQNYIPKKCLPSDYGGELPTLEELSAKTTSSYKELKEFFLSEEMLRKEWEESIDEY